MASKNETSRTGMLCEQIRKRGWVAHAIAGGNVFQTNGLPDRWFACVVQVGEERIAWSGFIEFKSHDGKLRGDQALLLKKAYACDPWAAFVVYFAEEKGGPLRIHNARNEFLMYCPREDGVLLLTTIVNRVYGPLV